MPSEDFDRENPQEGAESGRGTEHVIKITAVLKHAGSVEDPDRLLGKKKHVNLHGRERRVGVSLDIIEELRRSYECSCGKRFLKKETAAEHLREVSDGGE